METVFHLGIIPEQNIFNQISRYEPLAGYLSERIGRPVKIRILSRYGNILDNFRGKHLEAAIFGSFTYALSHRKIGVEVLARPEAADGTSTYYGVIFVRKDSGIRSARDMRGKRFVFVDRATTAGYLLPLRYFHDNGIEDYQTWFREAYFAGTHETAIADVLDGKADGGAAKNLIYEKMARKDPRIGRELAILARSPAVPEGGFAVRKDLDPELKATLKRVLLTMHQEPEGLAALGTLGAARFIETTERDYEPVYRYARDAGIDLATYDYRNDR